MSCVAKHIEYLKYYSIEVFGFGDVKIGIKINIRLVLKVYTRICLFLLFVGVFLLSIPVDVC
jgi:hypothetical protein